MGWNDASVLTIATNILPTVQVSSIERLVLELELDGWARNEQVFRDRLGHPGYGGMNWPFFRQILQRCSSLQTVTFKVIVGSLQPEHLKIAVKDTLLREIVEEELAEWDERGMLQVCMFRTYRLVLTDSGYF